MSLSFTGGNHRRSSAARRQAAAIALMHPCWPCNLPACQRRSLVERQNAAQALARVQQVERGVDVCASGAGATGEKDGSAFTNGPCLAPLVATPSGQRCYCQAPTTARAAAKHRQQGWHGPGISAEMPTSKAASRTRSLEHSCIAQPHTARTLCAKHPATAQPQRLCRRWPLRSNRL